MNLLLPTRPVVFIDPCIHGDSGLVRVQVLIDHAERKLNTGLRGCVVFGP